MLSADKSNVELGLISGRQDPIDPVFRLPEASDFTSAQQPPQQASTGRSPVTEPREENTQKPRSPAAEGQQEKGKKKVAAQHPRLRKACDACSARKIKCDESGPPCKQCSSLGIPCTFSRPSRRRGPRNRHADAIKEHLAHGGAGHVRSGPASPTYAAQTLASFAQQPVLSADSVCPRALLERLVDDYFTYAHPLVPVPHEPSFRAALAAREDMTSPTFLALLASMIGYLVASFPRRSRLHIHDLGMDGLFPNSNSNILMERCRRIAIEARGLGYLDRQQTVDDAMIAFLQGLIGAYNLNWDTCCLYLGQYVSISRVIGLHRQDGPGSAPVANADEHEGNVPQPVGDVVLRETSRRLFWTGYSTIISLQHLGVSARELSTPPPTNREPYPDLPIEVDDVYITSQGVRPMLQGDIARLTGFNAIMKVYKAYSEVSTMELAFGVNEVFDWAQQRVLIKQALESARNALIGLPSELLSAPESSPEAQTQPPQENHHPHTQGYPDLNGGHTPMQVDDSNYERRKTQFEIQKLNIAAAEVATRCTLMEKYSRLSDTLQSSAQTGQSPVDEMKGIRDVMIKDFLRMIRDLDLTYLEPAGPGFTNKLRQVATTLLNTPQHRTSEFHQRVQRYMFSLVDYINQVQQVGPGAADGVDEDDLRARQWAGLLQSMTDYI